MQLFYYLNLNTNHVTFTLIISLIAKYKTENFDVLKFTSLFLTRKAMQTQSTTTSFYHQTPLTQKCY